MVYVLIGLRIQGFEHTFNTVLQVAYDEVTFPAVSMGNLNALRKPMLEYGQPDLNKQFVEIGEHLQEQLSGLCWHLGYVCVREREKEREREREREEKIDDAQIMVLCAKYINSAR